MPRKLIASREDELIACITEILRLIETMPGGIDTEADLWDTSPENAAAHVGGLIWQECRTALGLGREGSPE